MKKSKVDATRANNSPSQNQKRRRTSTVVVGSEEHAAADVEQTKDREERHESNGKQVEEDGSIAVRVLDPDLLDCPICFHSLTIPVYQCLNGHVACLSCCNNLARKCPTCSLLIGHIRCIALEKLLESIKISCPNAKYGCNDTFSRCEGNYDNHKTKCVYEPCYCPNPGCDYVASSKDLCRHFRDKHEASGLQFSFGDIFPVLSKIDQGEAVILQEKTHGNLFLLCSTRENLGNAVRISCIGPKSEAGYEYSIMASSKDCSLSFQSVTVNIQQSTVGTTTPSGFLLIPKEFYTCEPLKLAIHIRSVCHGIPRVNSLVK